MRFNKTVKLKTERVRFLVSLQGHTKEVQCIRICGISMYFKKVALLQTYYKFYVICTTNAFCTTFFKRSMHRSFTCTHKVDPSEYCQGETIARNVFSDVKGIFKFNPNFSM